MGLAVGDDCGVVGGFGAVWAGVALGVGLGVGLGEFDWLQAFDGEKVVEKKESSVPIVASEMSSLNACILSIAGRASRPSVGPNKSFSLGKFKF